MEKTKVCRTNVMPGLACLAMIVFVVGAVANASLVAAADIPFSVTLEEMVVDGLPGLHSAAWGCYEGKLILIGGRTGGMHGFSKRTSSGKPSFPPPEANDSVYVVDLANHRLVGSARVDGLPLDFARQLRATNTQYVARGKWLYIVGGYGMTADQKAMETINRAVAIDMPALIAAVENREPLNKAFAQKSMFGAGDELLAVTGGALKVLHDDYLLLIFGHRFDGLYFVGGSNVTQTYTQCVRAFRFDVVDNQLKVKLVAQQPENPFLQPVDGPYHRRDLSVDAKLVLKDQVPQVQIAAYGGVFKGGLFEGYLNPIDIDITTAGVQTPPTISLTVDQATVQLMSQYECATISSFSLKQQTMYTTFFGGISQYYWDGQGLKRDKPNLSATPPIDGLPFINSVSTLKRGPDGNAQYLHVAQQFPPKPFEAGGPPALMTCLGAQTIFVPIAGVPNTHDVLLLDEIAKPIVVGYLFGGIATDKGYPTRSCASPKFYQVTLQPCEETNSIKLAKPD